MGDLIEFYGKDCLDSISMELYDLEKTGSYDERENMVCVVYLPRDIGTSVRRTYRSLAPSGIKDFRMIETNRSEDNKDREMCELYFGSSYGTGRLLASIGKLLYNSSEFGAEFDNQY